MHKRECFPAPSLLGKIQEQFACGTNRTKASYYVPTPPPPHVMIGIITTIIYRNRHVQVDEVFFVTYFSLTLFSLTEPPKVSSAVIFSPIFLPRFFSLTEPPMNILASVIFWYLLYFLHVASTHHQSFHFPPRENALFRRHIVERWALENAGTTIYTYV